MADIAYGKGVFFFPVTPFDASDRVDEDLFISLTAAGVDAGAGAVFAGCGTGEFHALSLAEVGAVARAAVTASGGRVPVIAGAGGPLGHALDAARAARDAGVDALLVMPPYLVNSPQAGLVAYVGAITRAAGLPVIVYHRANARFSVESIRELLANPLVVGVKDGVGDVALMQQFVRTAAASDRQWSFFNGLLTAEMSQAAYRAIGVDLYSSAAFAMAPRVASAFHRAYVDHDAETQARLLDGFYAPLIALRDQTPGFAVALIKAGLRLAGHSVGPVRAPLCDPTPSQTATLARILERGEELV